VTAGGGAGQKLGGPGPPGPIAGYGPVTITPISPPEQKNRAAERCYIAARARGNALEQKCSLPLVAILFIIIIIIIIALGSKNPKG